MLAGAGACCHGGEGSCCHLELGATGMLPCGCHQLVCPWAARQSWPFMQGIEVTSTAPAPEGLGRVIPAPCQGSWRVPTAQPGCHDNGRQPALPFRCRDSSICREYRERGRGRPSAAHPPIPHPCSKHCTLLHTSGLCCSFTCHLFAPTFVGLPAFFWPPSAPTCRIPLPPQALSTTRGSAPCSRPWPRAVCLLSQLMLGPLQPGCVGQEGTQTPWEGRAAVTAPCPAVGWHQSPPRASGRVRCWGQGAVQGKGPAPLTPRGPTPHRGFTDPSQLRNPKMLPQPQPDWGHMWWPSWPHGSQLQAGVH